MTLIRCGQTSLGDEASQGPALVLSGSADDGEWPNRHVAGGPAWAAYMIPAVMVAVDPHSLSEFARARGMGAALYTGVER